VNGGVRYFCRCVLKEAALRFVVSCCFLLFVVLAVLVVVVVVFVTVVSRFSLFVFTLTSHLFLSFFRAAYGLGKRTEGADKGMAVCEQFAI
jgi:hypothetical protein